MVFWQPTRGNVDADCSAGAARKSGSLGWIVFGYVGQFQLIVQHAVRANIQVDGAGRGPHNGAWAAFVLKLSLKSDCAVSDFEHAGHWNCCVHSSAGCGGAPRGSGRHGMGLRLAIAIVGTSAFSRQFFRIVMVARIAMLLIMIVILVFIMVMRLLIRWFV